MIQASLNIGAGFLFFWIFNELEKLKYQSKTNQKLKKQLQGAKLLNQSELNEGQIMRKKIQGSQQEASCIVGITVNRMPGTDFIFSKTVQALPINKNPNIHPEGFVFGAVGGQFQIGSKKLKIKVDLRECNIQESTLTLMGQKLPVVKNKQPSFQKLTFKLTPNQSFLLVGTLTYNLQTKTFTLIPSFLLKSCLVNVKAGLQNANQTISSKLSSIRNYQIIYCLLAILIILNRKNSILRLISSTFSWIKSFWVKPNQISEMKDVFSRPQDKLKCGCGKPLDMIYECGHLSICQRCHKNARRKICPVCREESKKFQKIFT